VVVEQQKDVKQENEEEENEEKEKWCDTVLKLVNP
jgi:hypothetical protein